MNASSLPPQSPTRATMQIVAAKAGVSLKSVSRVVNNEPHVSAALRLKVEEAIAALEYVPDIAARSLAGQRHFVIGLLLDNPSPHYSMELLSGAYRACREAGYTLQFDNINALKSSGDVGAAVRSLLLGSRVDGFVLTPPLTDDRSVLEMLESYGKPYVRVAPASDAGRSPAVNMDDRAAAAQIADYLWAHGHRRFGFVSSHPDHAAAMLRRGGFLERLRHYSPDIALSEADGDQTFEGGIRAGYALLSAEPRPTAIFAANDDTAVGVMSAAFQLGLRIPQDVSIIGFDDSWAARSVWPLLTTIRQPIAEMGEVAVKLLIERISAREEAAPRISSLDHAFIERASVGEAP